MAQESAEKSGGSGCLIAIAVIAIIGAAVYFAYYRDTQFPGSETVSNLTKNTLEVIGEGTTPNTNSPEIQGKPPEERHRELKEFMLQLTNQHRAAAGVPPVRLGTNPAAQIHAEEALRDCYSAHWDRWGLKPNHRYTMTGGTGADAENVSGSDYCIRPGENYRPNGPMEKEVAETVQGWMDSPGHRRSLLDPAHTVMNVGIAHDRFNTNMVQHFSSDYVQYRTKPEISPEGILRLSGQVSGATLEIGDSVNIQIGYDPPPKTLTRGQLANTYSLCNSKQVGYVVEPLPPNWFHRGPEVQTKTQEHPCVDPYQTDPNRPAPQSNEEAHQAWAKAKQISAASPPITIESRRITADEFNLSSNAFKIRANLTPILQKHGPGIYEITLWGRPDHMSENAPLSEQSIVWLTAPPRGNPYPIIQPPVPALITAAPTIMPAIVIPAATPPVIFTESTPAPVQILPPSTMPAPVIFTESTPEPVLLLVPGTYSALPTQTRTPTPIPPNIHSGTVGQYTYSLEFPRGWTPTTEQDGHAVFTSSGGAAGAEIRIGRLGSGGSTASLVERRNEELLERIRAAARTGKSDVYETKPHRPPPTTITDQLGQAWQSEYRWRESPDQCIRDVVEVISPSNRFTHSVLTSIWVCEDTLDEEAETERQKILNSFRARTQD